MLQGPWHVEGISPRSGVLFLFPGSRLIPSDKQRAKMMIVEAFPSLHLPIRWVLSGYGIYVPSPDAKDVSADLCRALRRAVGWKGEVEALVPWRWQSEARQEMVLRVL